ncbi:hypothetical protein CWC05_24605, partial [Pseudoalteromonas ruthenica]
LVRTKLLPENPVEQFKLNPELPTFYVARLNAPSDIAALDSVCQQLQLPRPKHLQTLAGKEIPRFIGLQNPT